MNINDKKEIKSSYLEGERLAHFKSLTGIEYKEVYTPEDISGAPETPGVYPFTRGIHKTMYRGRLWTRRQQSGYRSAKESNERIKYLLSVGQTGINMDPDLPTHLALDPDNPLAQGAWDSRAPRLSLMMIWLICTGILRSIKSVIP